MLEHLSYSSITLYLDCAEAWRRKYIAKEPTASSPALVFGSAFHGAVEAQLTTGQAALEAWPDAWSKALERDSETLDWGTDSPEFHHNEGVRLLSNTQVSAALAGLKARNDEAGPMVERKVTLQVPGVPVPIIGFIDFIASDGVPCDLKTANKAWYLDQAENSMQGLFYLAAMNQAGMNFHGWKFRHHVFVKTKEPKAQMFEVTHKPSQIMFLFKVIREVWESIEHSSFPPNPSSWKCSSKWCDHWSNCRGRYS